MIDEDIRAIKRRVFANKAFMALFLSIYTCLTALPIVLLLVFRSTAAGWIALTSASLAVALSAFILFRRGAWFVSRSTGAVPVKPEDFPELESLSEDISLAAGTPFPELMLVDDPKCCNLFSIRRKGRAVIYFGPRLLNKLGPGELRAAVAHEMAHIHNGDAGVNTLTISFRALKEYLLDFKPVTKALLSLLGYATPAAYFLCVAMAASRESNLVYVLPAACLFPLVHVFAFPLLSTMFVPSIILNRDLYADELAARWTLEPEALIDAMSKAQVHDKGERISFLGDLAFVPTISENPHKYMQSGWVAERIANLRDKLRLPRG